MASAKKRQYELPLCPLLHRANSDFMNTKLLELALESDLEMLKFILERGPDINSVKGLAVIANRFLKHFSKSSVQVHFVNYDYITNCNEQFVITARSSKTRTVFSEL